MMELQLGLALPSGLDLSACAYERQEHLGPRRRNITQGISSNKNQKRSFLDAFEDEAVPPTLPLFLWDDHPNEGDDDPKDTGNNFSSAFNNRNDGEDEGIIGRPPIKSRRKNVSRQNKNNRSVDNGCADCHGRRPLNPKYVKVKMEGVGIARKIDLSLFNSVQTLKRTLLDMFGNWTGQENSDSYKLTYQDSEGDWLLAEAAPWRSFVGSVRRLNLKRSSG